MLYVWYTVTVTVLTFTAIHICCQFTKHTMMVIYDHTAMQAHFKPLHYIGDAKLFFHRSDYHIAKTL